MVHYCPGCRVQVSSGHFGHVLNTLECSRGVYLVTMAMTELLLSMFESTIAMETNSLLASVVYLMQEVFSSCHKWRYQTSGGRFELGTGFSEKLLPHDLRLYRTVLFNSHTHPLCLCLSLTLSS